MDFQLLALSSGGASPIYYKCSQHFKLLNAWDSLRQKVNSQRPHSHWQEGRGNQDRSPGNQAASEKTALLHRTHAQWCQKNFSVPCAPASALSLRASLTGPNTTFSAGPAPLTQPPAILLQIAVSISPTSTLLDSFSCLSLSEMKYILLINLFTLHSRTEHNLRKGSDLGPFFWVVVYSTLRIHLAYGKLLIHVSEWMEWEVTYCLNSLSVY